MPEDSVQMLAMTPRELSRLVYQAAGAAMSPLLADHPDYVLPVERMQEGIEAILKDHAPEAAGIALEGYREAEVVEINTFD